MLYCDKILSEIITQKYNWTVCDVYFIHDLGNILTMTVKYYDRLSKYSVLMGKEIEMKKEDYFKHIRNSKLKRIINNI